MKVKFKALITQLIDHTERNRARDWNINAKVKEESSADGRLLWRTYARTPLGSFALPAQFSRADETPSLPQRDFFQDW